MNKGFTLVELVTIIVILGLLAIITTPAYDSISKNIRTRNFNSKKNTIEASTLSYVEKYMKDKIYSGKDDKGKKVCFTVNYLIKNGIISSDDEKTEYILNEINNREYTEDDILISIWYDTELLKLKAETINNDNDYEPLKKEDCTFNGDEYIY